MSIKHLAVGAIQIMEMAIVITVLLLFLGVGMLVIMHVCIVGRAFRRGFGNPGNFDRSSSRNRSMSLDDLHRLPSYDYIAKDKGSSPVDCAVCLENFKMGEKCKLLPQCRHSFHAECVDSWLLRNPICPICRTSADSSKDGLVLGEESSRSCENVVQLRGSPSREGSRHLDDVRIEIAENQTREARIITCNGHESRENQTNLVAIHSSFAIETTTTT
ncbi:RING-H2 finger protein ATL39-like [Durio zibethinus]|uniref:RING-type E3 ubiquitin transferase n=1 Tax=Durio zibethinus TaxID=66656 RepID=A0A6P5YMY9_DURZI|nr:RING-H2 finger protein ATL39-like [Durio zibethinus]